MLPEKKIEELVSRLRQAGGSNLQSVVLYGSAVSDEFHPGFSDINLLCLFRELPFSVFEQLASVVAPWNRQKLPTPLLMTTEELQRVTDVFVIELIDIQAHHRVLYGNADIISRLVIPTHLHRTQVEYELREKLILLRQRMLMATNNQGQLWELMARSVSSFVTLIRHALMLMKEPIPAAKPKMLELAALQLRFDASALLEILNVREHKTNPKKLDAKDVAARYLLAIEQVTAAVDKMLDSPGRHSS
jgi:predicted nucleotidyltransferase